MTFPEPKHAPRVCAPLADTTPCSPSSGAPVPAGTAARRPDGPRDPAARRRSHHSRAGLATTLALAVLLAAGLALSGCAADPAPHDDATAEAGLVEENGEPRAPVAAGPPPTVPPFNAPPAVAGRPDAPAGAADPLAPRGGEQDPASQPASATSQETAGAGTGAPAGTAAGAAAASSRGRYLAEEVAMCIQCHTPRNERGRLILTRRFEGAPVPVASPWPRDEWAFAAPAIAGAVGYSRQEMVRLLSEGITRDGRPPRPPMPPFRMNEADAGAIYDYLRTLPIASE